MSRQAKLVLFVTCILRNINYGLIFNCISIKEYFARSTSVQFLACIPISVKAFQSFMLKLSKQTRFEKERYIIGQDNTINKFSIDISLSYISSL